jgi:tetratricopeptide (TPR) repeat protein
LKGEAMKKINIIIVYLLFLTSNHIVFGPTSFSFPNIVQGSDTVVQKAYDLRMHGKLDEAKILLEGAIVNDSSNAAVYYEFVRLQLHKVLGILSKENLSNLLGDAQNNINRAVKLNPQNFIYTYFSGYIGFLEAYFSLMTGEQPKEKLAKAIENFESALKIKPDHYQTKLYLIELYSQFPEEAGGDRLKAEQYVVQLEGIGGIIGAKARSIVLPEETDKVYYWQNVLKQLNDNADVLEELGKAYLGEDKVDSALSCFEKAIEIDKEKIFLNLDMSIYYSFLGMRAGDDKELLKKCVMSGDSAIVRYIESKPIQPMLAYALGVRGRFKFFLGEQEQGQALFKEAETLDPYFSKATGTPSTDLFIPPGEISKKHRYLMRPF